jgi:hypothetical protein
VSEPFERGIPPRAIVDISASGPPVPVHRVDQTFHRRRSRIGTGSIRDPPAQTVSCARLDWFSMRNVLPSSPFLYLEDAGVRTERDHIRELTGPARPGGWPRLDDGTERDRQTEPRS